MCCASTLSRSTSEYEVAACSTIAPPTTRSSGVKSSMSALGMTSSNRYRLEAGGTSAVTVEFREFGVKLNFLPIVLGDGRIRLRVAPEVSTSMKEAFVSTTPFECA